jgi:hypothetical protein
MSWLPLPEAAIDPFVNLQNYFATAKLLPFAHANDMVLFSVPFATTREFTAKNKSDFA